MCSDIFSTFLLSSWSFLNRLLLEINQALVSGGGPLILQPLFSFHLVEIRKEFSVDLKRLSLWAASFRKTFRVIPVVWKSPAPAVLSRREWNGPILCASFPPQSGPPSNGVLLHRRG